MSMTFGRICLHKTTYVNDIEPELLVPVPVKEINRIYRAYCAHKHFRSVMPMIHGRFLVPGTEVWGYRDQGQLVAWSMYRIWDTHSVVCDHHAWDYRNPRLRLGIRSLHTECAIYRDRGFRHMYFESVEPYMFDIEGFEILGQLE